ncbi:hypothetical protein T484DRAFT_1764284 [Baffinella frigidus]|nr:hypothetical protein T484DRAFT_1764284 [Cryptophyta sp. CCMP2293]
MQASPKSCRLCEGPLCGLQEPRDHTFCRLCYKATLSKETYCPACKEPVDASEKLHESMPFAADKAAVKCPNGDGWTGAQKPRSYGGKWGGFRGEFALLNLQDLQQEALREGVDLIKRGQERTATQLRYTLGVCRDACASNQIAASGARSTGTACAQLSTTVAGKFVRGVR